MRAKAQTARITASGKKQGNRPPFPLGIMSYSPTEGAALCSVSELPDFLTVPSSCLDWQCILVLLYTLNWNSEDTISSVAKHCHKTLETGIVPENLDHMVTAYCHGITRPLSHKVATRLCSVTVARPASKNTFHTAESLLSDRCLPLPLTVNPTGKGTKAFSSLRSVVSAQSRSTNKGSVKIE